MCFIVAENLCEDFFSGECVWDEYNPAFIFQSFFIKLDSGDTYAKVAKRRDLDFDFLMVFERVGMEFLGLSHVLGVI